MVFELPTGRRSFNSATPVDIHDPNWIPVLDGGVYKAPLSPTEKEVSPTVYASASFSLFPSQTGSPKPRPGFSHSYSRSSLAPESIKSESRSQSSQDNAESPSSAAGAVQAQQNEVKGHHRRQTSVEIPASEEKISVGTENPGDVLSAASTDDYASVAEDRPSSRPEQTQDAMRDQNGEPLINPSTMSSVNSTRRNTIFPPTSKYNRKPVTSIATSVGRPSVAQSLPQTPMESPRMGPIAVDDIVPTTPGQALESPKLTPAEHSQGPDTAAKPQPTKSSASDRRHRALHSHPSNLSLQSRRNSISEEPEIVSKPPSVRLKPRKSTDSRPPSSKSTVYDSQIPTPAPTTPLPQIPPQIQSRRSSQRENASHKATHALVEEPIPSTISNFRPFEHAEMASFMTEKNTIVFRRFDDVHVRLLLCLQDEISLLENELLKLESPASSGSPSEKMMSKTRILRELRKIVAEYGESQDRSARPKKARFLTFCRSSLHDVVQDASQQSQRGDCEGTQGVA